MYMKLNEVKKMTNRAQYTNLERISRIEGIRDEMKNFSEEITDMFSQKGLRVSAEIVKTGDDFCSSRALKLFIENDNPLKKTDDLYIISAPSGDRFHMFHSVDNEEDKKEQYTVEEMKDMVRSIATKETNVSFTAEPTVF